MGCCGMTQRHTGVDEVGPDEIELLELSGDNLGVWSLSESRLQLAVKNSRDEQQPPLHNLFGKHLQKEVVLWGRSREELHHRIYSQQPIKGWEGQPAHLYGEIVYSSPVALYSSYTQETHDYFLVFFSFHLLLLSVDHTQQDFMYEGMLPLSGLSFQAVSLELDTSCSPHMFEISSPLMDSKIFICPNTAEILKWQKCIEDREYKSMTQSLSASHCALSYLLPCDEPWKQEELKKYLMRAPIWQWEGAPIPQMGWPGYLSVVHIINTQRQVLQERLMVLFPQDILLLSVDTKQLYLKYEGRLARQSIRAVERSAMPGQLEFEMIGELLEPLQVSCMCLEDYQKWIFHLQQPDRKSNITVSQAAPSILPKQQRSHKEPQEPMTRTEQYHINEHG